MPKPTITPISALVADTKEYFEAVVRPALVASRAEPASKSNALAAFILLYHTKDWAKDEGLIASEDDLWRDCPFAQVIAEIANGGKHRIVNDTRLTGDPTVLEFRVCGYGQGGWDVGPYGRSNIQVKGRQSTSEPVRWHSTHKIFTEAAAWWEKQFGL